MSTYLWINLLAISIPFIITFHPKFKFYKKWNALWPALILPAIFFIAWDIYFTDLGIWGFNAKHLSGIYIFNLPIEEVLFFIAIPYACMFTYDVIRENFKHRLNPDHLRNFIVALSITMLAFGIMNIDRLYTSTTFILTALFLLMHLYWLKSQYLDYFFLAYLVIYLFPFLIVNGVLTGSIVSEPVVWYNNEENLGIRVITIPIEDFIYGMLLYLMNTTVYETLLNFKEKRFQKRKFVLSR